MHLARKVLNQVLSGMEVILAGFLIIIIAILAFKLAAGTFFGEALVPKSVSWYIEQVMNLAIGIEFAKMLFHHTPGTIIEVLLFAISRHMIVEQTTPLETLFGVAALAGLFAIKKYLFTSFREHERIICSGQTTIKKMNQRYGLSIPADGSRLLCDVVRENLKKHDLPAEVGMSFVLGDATLRIEEMHEGSIRKVELVKTRSLFNE